MKLICGHSSGFKRFARARDYVTQENFDLIECSQCNLIQTKFDLSKKDLSAYYPAAYYGSKQRYSAALNACVGRLVKMRLNLIKEYLPATANVLDIGCGQGWLLKELKDRGCGVTGVEISEQAAYHARDVLGLNTLVGDVRDLKLTQHTYDCIIIWHVLEHVHEPMGLLEHVRQLLKEDGILLLAVPDYSSPEARFSGSGWFHLDVPRHLSHFEKDKLEQHFNSRGLHVLGFSNFVPEYDFFSFIQSVLNRLGIQQNCLYAFLRSDAQGPLIKSKLKKNQVLISLALLPALSVISLFWVFTVTIMNKGATVAYVLRKQPINGTE